MSNNNNDSAQDNSRSEDKDQQLKTGADFEQTVREAEEERGTLEPGQSQGSNSKQDNNGRGGGK